MLQWEIGASTIGREWMVPAIGAQPDARVAAVASSDSERGRRYADALSIPRTYPSVTDLLADPTIDAVYISTTNEWHEPQALAAVAAGSMCFVRSPGPVARGCTHNGRGRRCRRRGDGHQSPPPKCGDPPKDARVDPVVGDWAAACGSRLSRRSSAAPPSGLAHRPSGRRWRRHLGYHCP